MTAFPEFPADGHAFSAAEVGQALAGLIKRDSAGMPVPGMLTVPSVAAVASTWKVQIGRFVHVRSVSGSVRFSGLSASEQVDIVSAAGISAGQARIDLIVWDPVAAALSVVQGTAAASPVAPSPGAFVPVATVRVQSGDGAVIAGQVTPVYVSTSLVSAGSITETVPITLAGATGGAAGFYWRSFSVTFPTPFDAPPHLVTTGVFPAEAIQFEEITQVTATGFTGRVIRVAHATVLPGQVTYTATEK